MNIVVYCGSNPGDGPAFEKTARELGAWIARSGNRLVYGGSKTGLMAAVADAALELGGEVWGVEVRLLAERGFSHTGLTRLEVAESMPARRARMLELGDAFVALPGGIGTLDELSEAVTGVRLGIMHAPCIALDVNGYYEQLRRLWEGMFGHGFLPPDVRGALRFAPSVGELAEMLD